MPPLNNNQGFGSTVYSLISALMGTIASGFRSAFFADLLHEGEVGRWQSLNRMAEENMKREKELNLILEQIRQSQKPWESRRALRGEKLLKTIREILPQDKRQLFDLDPEKFVGGAIEKEREEGAGEILRQLGFGDGAEMAKVLGPKDVGSLIESALESRRSKNRRYWFYFHVDSGHLFVGDVQTGKAGHWLLVDPKAVPEESEQLGTGTTDESLDDYVNSPERQALGAFLLGNISREQHDALQQQFRQAPRGLKWLISRALRIVFTTSRALTLRSVRADFP